MLRQHGQNRVEGVPATSPRAARSQDRSPPAGEPWARGAARERQSVVLAEESSLRLGRLIGRHSELRMMDRLLNPRGERLLTLTGPVGVGKSSLARSALSQISLDDGVTVTAFDLAVFHSFYMNYYCVYGKRAPITRLNQ